MRRTAVGPYQIVKRQGRFKVHDGSAILSRHSTFADAEDAAIRRWLHKSRDDEEPRSGDYEIVI
jgi:hypothetical protein